MIGFKLQQKPLGRQNMKGSLTVFRTINNFINPNKKPFRYYYPTTSQAIKRKLQVSFKIYFIKNSFNMA